MDKRGALYFKLVTGVFLLILAGYALDRLWSREPAYELYSTQICEVGDGMTVSGFVVRHESLLTSQWSTPLSLPEGQWIGGGQAVNVSDHRALIIPRGGYVSGEADGYEGVLTPEFVLNCKGEALRTLCPRPLPENAVGRLIHGQTWYFVAPGAFPSLRVGETLSLSIGDVECTARVLRAQELLLLECEEYAHRVTALRECQAQLTTQTRTGIALPGQAVYYEAGEACVYVLHGERARRRAVAILRTEGDRVWVDPTDLPEGAQVILTDIELSDGMVLK